MSTHRPRGAAVIVALLALSPAPAQDAPAQEAIVGVRLLVSPACWTPEMGRLAAWLEYRLAAGGAEPVFGEILPPCVISLGLRERAGSRLTSASLSALLREPQLRRWPQCRVIGTDHDPRERRCVLRGRVSFWVERDRALGPRLEEVVRVIVRARAQDLHGELAARRLMEGLTVVEARPARLAGDDARASVTALLEFAVPASDAAALARTCALFAGRPRLEARWTANAPREARAELFRSPSEASFREINAGPALASAALLAIPHYRRRPGPFRVARDVALLERGEPLLASEDFLGLEASRDSLGRAALGWTLTPAANRRLAEETSRRAGARVAFLVNGEVWSEVVIGAQLAGPGRLFGDFDEALLDAVVRGHAPMSAPASWQLEGLQVR